MAGDRWRTLSRVTRPCVAALVAGVVVASLATSETLAGSVTGYVELSRAEADTETRSAAGESEESEATSIRRRYSVDFTQQLWPHLMVTLGGLFESRDDEGTAGEVTDRSDLRRFRPYFSMALRGAIFSGELRYTRNEQRQEVADPLREKEVRETYFTSLGWTPDDYPSTVVQYTRTNHYEGTKRGFYRTSDSVRVVVDDEPAESLRLRYEGIHREQRDRVDDIETTTTIHSGRARYSESWLDRRITFGADYRVSYREREVVAPGGGVVPLPLDVVAGLSALDDRPEFVALLDNPALIDGDRTAPSGINIGLPGLGDDDSLRNLGVDFRDPLEVNTLLVYVDRELPPEIAETFSWSVWASDDNLVWSLRGAVSRAEYDPFQARFLVEFPRVETRYVKVVVAPLAATAPDAIDYPLIAVTELEAELRVPPDEVRGTSSSTTNYLSLNSRAKLHESPNLYYDFAYLYRDSGEGRSRSTLTNGLQMTHAFNRVYSTAARVSREDVDAARADATRYSYSTNFTITPLDTLRTAVAFSGDTEDVEGRRSRGSGYVVSTAATLYPGIEFGANAGSSYRRTGRDRRDEATTVAGTLTLVPHRSTTTNVSYFETTGRTESLDAGTAIENERRGVQVNLTFSPTVGFYLLGVYTRETGAFDRTIREYQASWAPFRDGTLRLDLNYLERSVTDFEKPLRIARAGLRWYFARRSFLEVAYRDLRASGAEVPSTTSVTSTLRIGF